MSHFIEALAQKQQVGQFTLLPTLSGVPEGTSSSKEALCPALQQTLYQPSIKLLLHLAGVI